MKDFDLAAAKCGATVCTRNGWPARILCFDRKGGERKIVAALLRPNGEEDVAIFYDDGRYYIDDTSPFDIMMADDDYLEKLERGESEHIEDNLDMVGKPYHIGEATEKVDWAYWRMKYAGMTMKAMMDNYNQNCDDMTEEPVFASFVVRRSVFVADAIIDRLKKTQK